MRDYYSITELTREFDISTRTLRFYEDEGLIQPIRRGRTRLTSGVWARALPPAHEVGIG